MKKRERLTGEIKFTLLEGYQVEASIQTSTTTGVSGIGPSPMAAISDLISNSKNLKE